MVIQSSWFFFNIFYASPLFITRGKLLRKFCLAIEILAKYVVLILAGMFYVKQYDIKEGASGTNKQTNKQASLDSHRIRVLPF